MKIIKQSYLYTSYFYLHTSNEKRTTFIFYLKKIDSFHIEIYVLHELKIKALILLANFLCWQINDTFQCVNISKGQF